MEKPYNNIHRSDWDKVRFWSFVEVSGQPYIYKGKEFIGCWEWTGATQRSGYGTFARGFKYTIVHRIAYILLVGEIPKGLVIDHLCGNRKCCNPEHLEAVTTQENNKRCGCCTMPNVRKTHCPSGHEYTPENTRISIKKGKNNHTECRNCRECQRIAQRKFALEFPERKKASRQKWYAEHGAEYRKAKSVGKPKRQKLSDEDITNIRSDYSSGVFTQEELGEKYNVTGSYVSTLVNRKAR